MKALALAAAAAFNLTCSGEARFGELKGFSMIPVTGKFQRTFRVDLTSKRYCKDDCTQTSALYNVSETSIAFQFETDGKGNDTIETVNRETGDYMFRIRFLPMISMDQGKCEAAPFTGFPSRKF